MSKEDDDQEIEKRTFWAPTPESRLLALFEKLSARVEANDQESRRRDEENQRNISFILEQQAQFTSDMQQMREIQAQADEKWERRWGRTEESIRALLTIAEVHNQEITALADGQARLTEAQERTDRQMAETDERLNALVNVVERFISERRNGGSSAS
ncbi:MAG: hypothetical protein LC785_06810 [Acidobacteria bacterium]|nr:hypothetical protein [Acidobacteriota bacterium]MCA1641646.1 hypothetical protein [Acidobacteriota bacterium]